MLLFVSMLVCISFIFGLRHSATLQPFHASEQYINVSHAMMDAEESLYTIVDSKKYLKKIDSSGKLIYSISSEVDANSDQVYMFNDVTTDASGTAYVLLTILDHYGLKVVGEQIIRISPDGKRRTVLYNEKYEVSDSLIRVGKLQNLFIDGSKLYFFSKQRHAATMYSIDVQSSILKHPDFVTQIELKNNQSLKEVVGSPYTPIFFTTKQGFLYSQKEQNTTQLFPTSDTITLNFPVEIEVTKTDKLYYLDQHAEAVMSLAWQEESSEPVEVITLDKLRQQYDNLEWSGFTDLSLDHGHIVIATLEQIIELDTEGNILQIMDSYRYSKLEMLERIGFWVIVAALIILMIYTIRFIYVSLMKRKVYLLMKQLIFILPVLVICMAWLSYSVFQSVSMEKKQDTYKQLKILAANGKYLVDGDDLEQLTSPRDYRSTPFVTVKQRLNEVFSLSGEDRDGLYNTIYRYMDGNLYIVMDDDDSATMFTPFEINENNSIVLEKGELNLGEWQDASGEWMYALGPIFNGSGEIVGIYETGKDMTGVIRSNMRLLTQVLEISAWIGLVLAIVITLMTAYFLSSIRKLRRSVNQIASGEWNVNVNISTRDEVEELGDRFNMMAGAIKKYVLEVTKLSNAYFRFVPQQFLKVLGKDNMTEVRLGEQKTKNMTIMVCHMRQFNEMSATLSTKDNFAFINSFLKQFGPIIREHGGFISRYLGPGMLTMFPNDSTHSLFAAYHIRRALTEYNEKRIDAGERAIDIGIAIHAGDVMLGIIGEEQRLEGSVISNHVELTINLERISEKLGVSVLLTSQARQQIDLGRTEYCRNLGLIQLDSDSAPVQLYDWYEADMKYVRDLKAETKKQFEASVEAYQNGRFYDAREGFVQVVKRNRHDLVAKLYFFASDASYQAGTQINWNTALKIS